MALIYVSAWADAEVWRRQVTLHLPGEELRVWPDVGDAEAIDVALVWRPPFGALRMLPRLKLIANLGAGVEYLLGDPDLPKGVPIARLVDPAMTAQMSEYVALGVMTGLRKLIDYQGFQRERRWVEIDRDIAPPGERTVGVLGLGELGRDAARKLGALGYRVAGWSRTRKRLARVRCCHGRDRLAAFLGQCDAVVCLLPLTPETRGIINRETLGWMKPGVVLVNAARGGHVVDADLLAALDEDRVSLAFLDVFNDEPLPADHRYWSHPRVVVTPHVAALTLPSMAGQILANVKRLRAGQPLLNLVDTSQGY
ncbi:MAG: glyoxylate/hydroxypyruvate reductase A [Alphaproteobacteria bacterium]